MKGRLKSRAMIKVGNGIAAMLSPDEVRQVELLAKAESMWPTIWAAAVIRERLRSEARRHGVHGERGTGLDSPHETLPSHTERKARAAGSSPAILSVASPGDVRGLPQGGGVHPAPPARSWGNLGTDERIALASEWVQRVPLPPNFKAMNAQQKTAWCDAAWPLILPSRTEEELEF